MKMSPPSDAIKVKAVINFPDYQKLQQYLGCKNSDVKLVCYDDDNNREGANGVPAQIFNKTFNILAESCGENKPTIDAVTETEEERAESLEAQEPEGSSQQLFRSVPSDYRDRAKKLLAALNLENYRGGTVSIDSQTYDFDSLADILEKLYGKKRISAANFTIDGRMSSFLNSIKSRKGLKKFVKNKKLLKKTEQEEENQASSDWWKFE